MDNFFDLFEIPQSLNIDETALKRIFFVKSREFHPDFFTLASQAEQSHALTMTSLYNTGLKVLTNPQSLLAHFLDLHGVEVKGNNQALPPAFLFEMMNLNEAIEDATSEKAKAEVSQQVDTFEAELVESARDLFSSEDLSDISASDLAKLKEVYLKRQYLKRLRTAIDQ